MSSLLQTKLYLPQTSAEFVDRPHLFDRLDQSLDKKLTLISAPAGFGKSTLTAAWLRRLVAPDLRPAWFSIDDGDNDPVSFLSYLTAALHTAAPGAVATVQSLLEQPTLPAPERLAVELARACANLPVKVILALDDYHLVHEPAIHRFMVALLRHLPPSLHLVVIGRFDPPLGLSQLRGRDEVAEFRAADLQFSLEETQRFFDVAVGKALAPEVAQTLQEQTEGWVVGLRLAAISLQAASDPAAFVARFAQHSNRYVIDYLVDEALARQAPSLQDFLLRTALLSRFNAALAAAVLDQDERASQAWLEELERHNLFLVALDDHREWYRYHHQFQTMLQTRLRARESQAAMVALRRRAAEWLGAHGLVDEALEHYAAIPDHIAAAGLVEQHVTTLLNTEQLHRLDRWLTHLPDRVIAERPPLLLARARRFAQLYQFEAARRLIDQAERLLQAKAAQPETMVEPSTWGVLYAMRGMWELYREAPVEQGIAYVRQALQLLPPEQALMRGVVYADLASLLLRAGKADRAIQEIKAEIADADPDNKVYLARLRFALMLVYYFSGSLDGVWVEGQALLVLASRERFSFSVALAQYALGFVCYQRNELTRAIEFLAPLIAEPYQASFYVALLGACLLIVSYVETGQLDQARQVVAVLRGRLDDIGPSQRRHEVDALAAYLAWRTGDLAAARWANSATEASVVETEQYSPLIRAQVWLALGDSASLQRAGELLDAFIRRCAEQANDKQKIAALILQAQLLWTCDLPRRALGALEEAVELGYPRGYRRWFIEGGPVVAEMLARLAQQGRCVEAARALLALFPAGQSAPSAPLAPQAAPSHNGNLVEPLTEREIEILALMAAGLTNKEIAHRLRISPLTVRNHSSNIYGKLGVDDRAQAVSYARALGLLRA